MRDRIDLRVRACGQHRDCVRSADASHRRQRSVASCDPVVATPLAPCAHFGHSHVPAWGRRPDSTTLTLWIAPARPQATSVRMTVPHAPASILV